MAYVLQIPDQIIVNGESFANGYVRLSSGQIVCRIGVQIFNDITQTIARGPEILTINIPLQILPSDIKKMFISRFIFVIREWRDKALKELQAQTALGNIIQSIKTEFGI